MFWGRRKIVRLILRRSDRSGVSFKGQAEIERSGIGILRHQEVLDLPALHTTQAGKPTTAEDDFEAGFNEAATGGAELFRCRFARYSHCKIIILKKNGAAFRVLTGSTNFAITGLCVNANHVLVFGS